MEYIRDYTMYTAIFGFFSFVWFGWAQENPRKSWRLYIGIASAAALLISIGGIYLSVKHWDASTALDESGAYAGYLTFVALEFLLAGAGAILLIKKKRKDYVAPWIAFIVGVHFIGLKSIFQDASLYLLAVLLIGVAIGSLFIAKKLNVANSAITGIGSGIVLFGFAVYGFIRFLLA